MANVNAAGAASVETKIRQIKSLYGQVVQFVTAATTRKLSEKEVRKVFRLIYRQKVSGKAQLASRILSKAELESLVNQPAPSELIGSIKRSVDEIWLEVKPLAERNLRRIQEPQDRQNILDDFYLKDLLGSILAFRDDGAPFTNMLAVAIRRKRWRWLQKKAELGRLERSAEGLKTPLSEIPGKTTNSDNALLIEQLFKLYIDRFGRDSIRDLRVLRLSHMERLSHSEIAEELHMSEGNSRVILHRTLKRMLEILRETKHEI
jgi:RNA polymerase sigma factor (sigma-70 family)